MTRALVAALAVFSLAACNAPSPPATTVSCSPAASVPPGTFTVVGTATLEVEPDTADLHVTVLSQASRPGAAAKATRAKQTRLYAALTALGLEAQDIKLSHLSINPIWNHETGRTTGYEAAISVTASTKDFDEIGAMMDAAADAGATNMSSSFRTDLTVLKSKVRDMALTAARDKAGQIAKALDVDLGKIVAIAENNGGGWSYWGGENAVANVYMEQPSKLVSSTTAELQPLTLSISVTYQLT
jgi:uncharacterized protein YggE